MHKDFKFHLQGNTLLPDAPTPLRVKQNDSLKFHIPNGRLRLQMDPGHGFDADAYDSQGPELVAKRAGRFVLHCSAHLADGRDVGWAAGDTASGTDIIIETNIEN